MAPSAKILYLADHLRGRLHGDVKDIDPKFVPADRTSGNARLRFDEHVERAIKKYGEDEVENILQRFYNKVKDFDREAELRVWEMICGPERTFRDRAYRWGDNEDEMYRRAQRVRAVYEGIGKGRKRQGGKIGEGNGPGRQDRLKARGDDQGQEKKGKSRPKGRGDYGNTQAGGPPKTPQLLASSRKAEHGHGTPAPMSNHRVRREDEIRRERVR